MSENAETSEEAFRELVKILEGAVKAGADAVGLERDGQDLMVIHYFGSMGREMASVRKNMEHAVIREIVGRAGLVEGFRGTMQLSLLGKSRNVVVDKRDDFGESQFTLTLKKTGKKQSVPLWPEEKLPEMATHEARVGRNDPCPCGSGKKYKKCCLNKQKAPPQFPIGTIAYYGPDDKITTKIVAGVIMAEGAEAIIKRWVATDVATSPKVQGEIDEFFKNHGVKQVAMSAGNMGCPHEEGEDFPDGGDCPFCPWWKGKQGSGAKE